jgi:serine/threonine protein kinase
MTLEQHRIMIDSIVENKEFPETTDLDLIYYGVQCKIGFVFSHLEPKENKTDYANTFFILILSLYKLQTKWLLDLVKEMGMSRLTECYGNILKFYGAILVDFSTYRFKMIYNEYPNIVYSDGKICCKTFDEDEIYVWMSEMFFNLCLDLGINYTMYPSYIGFTMPHKRCLSELPSFKFDLRKKLEVVYRLALRVQEAHDMNIAHGDIKPHNVYIDEYNVYLYDWGQARAMSQISYDINYTTELFAAPECFSKYTVYKIDQWSFGCMMYFIFTEKILEFDHDKKNYEKILKDVWSLPMMYFWDSHKSPKLYSLFGKIMQVDPHERISFQTILRELCRLDEIWV